MRYTALVLLVLVSCVQAEPAADLTEKIAAVAPISGVSIKDPNDKTTWRIDLKPEATPEQAKAAQDIVAAFDATMFSPTKVDAARLRRQLCQERAILNAMDAELVEPDNANNADLKTDRDAQAKLVADLRAKVNAK